MMMVNSGFQNKRKLVLFAIFSSIFFCQIGFNVDSFPLTLHLLAYLCFPFFLLNDKSFGFNFLSLVVFFVFAIFGFVSVNLAGNDASYTSLALLLALYLPFVIKKNKLDLYNPFFDVGYWLVDLVVVISCIALFQYLFVNLFNVGWLSNVSEYIPEAIHAAGVFNYLREADQGAKANGFFLKEPSFLSMYTALCLIYEFNTRRSMKKMALLSAGLAVSMSGTGVLVVLISLFFPSGRNFEVKLVFSLIITVLIGYLIQTGSDSNPWLSRVSEFSTEGTSGYARFVAPLGMLNGDLDDFTIFGNGAGSYARAVVSLGMPYEIHDPTWVKLLYEYGIFGFLLLFYLVVSCIKKAQLPFSFKAALLYSWLFSGGLLLNPEFILILRCLAFSNFDNRGANGKGR